MKLVRNALLSLLCAGAACAAYAVDPWVSVPSTPTAPQRLVVSGGSLGANVGVRVQITQPDGFVAQQAAASDAAGNLRFEYPLGPYGSYSVKVFDASGKLIGGGVLGYIR